MEAFTEIKTINNPFNNLFGLYFCNAKNNKYLILTKNQSTININYQKLIPSLINDYLQGNYTRVPYKTIISSLSLLYFIIKPKKKLSEKLPIVKSIKLLSIILLLLKSIQNDLIRYQIWKNAQTIPGKKIRVN